MRSLEPHLCPCHGSALLHADVHRFHAHLWTSLSQNILALLARRAHLSITWDSQRVAGSHLPRKDEGVAPKEGQWVMIGKSHRQTPASLAERACASGRSVKRTSRGPEFSTAEGEAQGLGVYKKEPEERGWNGIQKGFLCPK